MSEDAAAHHWVVRIEMASDDDPIVASVWETEPSAVEEAGELLVAGYPTEAAARRAATHFGPRAVVARVEDDTWADEWRAHAEPTVIGRFTIVPTWCDPPTSGDGMMIHLDPGRAFGSGSHPSTRLILGLVPDLVSRKTRVLDVGTGSGVLAVASALVGADPVVGIDIEAEAVGVAAANAARNGVAATCRFSADPLDRVDGVFDVVLANILPGTLLRLADDLVARLAPGGRLALSGIPSADADRVASGVGGRVLVRAELDDWTCLVLG